MNKIQKFSGIALAAAAATVFATSGFAAAHTGGKMDEAKVKCEGANSCKGQNDCKGAKNACKGQGSCKGTGMKEMSKADCDKSKADAKK